MAAAVNQPPLSEIRTLAVGFLELSAAPLPPRRAPAALAAALAAPLPAGPSSARVRDRTYGVEDREVVPPLAMRESWAPLADVFAVRTGVIEIVIDAAGSVEAAAMSVPVNAVYDRLALTTAKRWRYKPATLDGVPVKFRKVILLDLKATR
jgi:TonB family protein